MDTSLNARLLSRRLEAETGGSLQQPSGMWEAKAGTEGRTHPVGPLCCPASALPFASKAHQRSLYLIVQAHQVLVDPDLGGQNMITLGS